MCLWNQSTTSFLQIAYGSNVDVHMGWFKCPSGADYAATLNALLYLSGFVVALLGHGYDLATTLTARENFAGVSTTVLTGSSGVWVWVCIRSNSGVGCRVSWALEGAGSLTHVDLADGFDFSHDTFTWLNDPGFQGNINTRCSMLRGYPSFASFSDADALAEYGSATPVKASPSYVYSCAVGSTIGADTSGNGKTATATGTLTLNADEPTIGGGGTTTPVSKTVAVSASLVQTKQVGAPRSVAVTVAKVITKQVGVIRSVAATAAKAVLRQVGVVRAVASAGTTTAVKQVGAPKTRTVSAALAQSKQVGVVRAVAMTAGLVFASLKVQLRSFTVGVAASLALIKRVGVVRVATVVAALVFARLLLALRSFSVGVTASPVFSALKVQLRAFSAGVAAGLATSKQVGVVRSLGIAGSSAVLRAVARSFAASSGTATAIAKRISTSRSVGVTATPSSQQSRLSFIVRTVAVTTAFVAVRAISLGFGMPVAVVLSLRRVVSRAFSLAVTSGNIFALHVTHVGAVIIATAGRIWTAVARSRIVSSARDRSTKGRPRK